MSWRAHWLFMTWLAALTAQPIFAAETGVVENSIGLKLVRVSAGAFTMGSPEDEKGRRADELQRQVRITRDYEIGQFEVTRGQFQKFVEATNYKTDAERGLRGGYGFDETTMKLAGPDHKYSWRFTGFPQTDEHPVVNVSWNDANAFCRWLTETEKRTYRLPTEAEWEYACRGGSTTAYANGDDPEKVIEAGNIMDAPTKMLFPDRIAVAGSDGFIFTAPVGSFQANALGIHDMHGNVWEWTADWFGDPPMTPQVDPRGPDSGKDKVVRGGDWYHDWSFARCAQRFPIYPSLCRRHAGFRVVREVSTVDNAGKEETGPSAHPAKRAGTRVLQRVAKDTITPIELDWGDELQFKLRNGAVRKLRLVRTEARIVEGSRLNVKKYAFTASVELDGDGLDLERIVPAQESFYEPVEKGGMRIWLDAVSDIFLRDDGFLGEKDEGIGITCQPKRKARLAVNDLQDRICPEKLVWWYPEKGDRLDVRNCYRGEDVWMGPYDGKLAHGGLDINMKSGTPLHAPIDFDEQFLFNSLAAGHNNNRWRGVRRWPDGSVWWLQAHHLNKLIVPEHTPLKRGTLYAETAGVHIGAREHSHFAWRISEDGEDYWLDPWILFWQTFRDQRRPPGGTSRAAPPPP